MPAIRIQDGASHRLDDIYRYTRDRWGDAQAETYITGLFAAFERIAAHGVVSKPIPAEFGVEGYFFRYEREETTDPVRKPAYHMHVILDLPHFVAPPVNLEIILKMIAINFYSLDIYSKQIVGQEVRLTV